MFRVDLKLSRDGRWLISTGFPDGWNWCQFWNNSSSKSLVRFSKMTHVQIKPFHQKCSLSGKQLDKNIWGLLIVSSVVTHVNLDETKTFLWSVWLLITLKAFANELPCFVVVFLCFPGLQQCSDAVSRTLWWNRATVPPQFFFITPWKKKKKCI